MSNHHCQDGITVSGVKTCWCTSRVLENQNGSFPPYLACKKIKRTSITKEQHRSGGWKQKVKWNVTWGKPCFTAVSFGFFSFHCLASLACDWIKCSFQGGDLCDVNASFNKARQSAWKSRVSPPHSRWPGADLHPTSSPRLLPSTLAAVVSSVHSLPR